MQDGIADIAPGKLRFGCSQQTACDTLAPIFRFDENIEYVASTAVGGMGRMGRPVELQQTDAAHLPAMVFCDEAEIAAICQPRRELAPKRGRHAHKVGMRRAVLTEHLVAVAADKVEIANVDRSHDDHYALLSMRSP